jgi:hypothetical protein
MPIIHSQRYAGDSLMMQGMPMTLSRVARHFSEQNWFALRLVLYVGWSKSILIKASDFVVQINKNTVV